MPEIFPSRQAANLRAILDKPRLGEAASRTPLGHGEVDICLKGGLQHGALHEVFAMTGHEVSATGFVMGLALRVVKTKHLLWIGQDFSTQEFGRLSPTGLFELGVDPARVLFLSTVNAGDGLRAANDALSCATLGAVVLEISGRPKVLDLVASRRLALAATQKSVTAFLLRLGAEPDASTAETRWLVGATASKEKDGDWGYPAFEVSLIRNRHGKTGHWFMEWNCDQRIFQGVAENLGALASTTAN